MLMTSQPAWALSNGYPRRPDHAALGGRSLLSYGYDFSVLLSLAMWPDKGHREVLKEKEKQSRYTFLWSGLHQMVEKEHSFLQESKARSALEWSFSPDDDGETRYLNGTMLDKSQACNNTPCPHGQNLLWGYGWGCCLGNSWWNFPCLLQTQKNTWKYSAQGTEEEGSRVHSSCCRFSSSTTCCLLQTPWLSLNKDPKLLKEKEQFIKVQSLPITQEKREGSPLKYTILGSGTRDASTHSFPH